MDSAKLNDWMQVVGIFAVVASLIFVGLQLQQDRELAAAQLFSDADDSITNTAISMNDNIDVWVKGSRGDKLTTGDEAIFHNLFMSVRFSYGSFYEASRRLDGLPPGWVSRKFAYQLFVNPGLRRIWDQRLEFDRDQSEAFELPHTETLTQFEAEISGLLDGLDSGEIEPSDIENFASW